MKFVDGDFAVDEADLRKSPGHPNTIPLLEGFLTGCEAKGRSSVLPNGMAISPISLLGDAQIAEWGLVAFAPPPGPFQPSAARRAGQLTSALSYLHCLRLGG